MGGAFGGMMLRHARALGYSVEADNTVHYQDLPKGKRKRVVDDGNPELEAIQERYQKERKAALQNFCTGVRDNYDALKKAGVIRHGDLVRDILQRAMKGKLVP